MVLKSHVKDRVLKTIFCHWRVPEKGAVEIAWKRLASLFVAAGESFDQYMHGKSVRDLSRLDWRYLRDQKTIVCADIWQNIWKLFDGGNDNTFAVSDRFT